MEPHRVLDLDLDFFLDHRAEYRSDNGPRLSDEEYRPWPAEDVRAFLEHRCGLSRSAPVPGRFAVHHDGAFFWWRELIDRGDLTPPFEVVHVDAHSDTGYDASTPYIMTDLLHKPVAERRDPLSGPKGLHPGNYLIFAIACRWLSLVQYVRHSAPGDDFGRFHFKSNDPRSGAFQLKRCTLDQISGGYAMYGPAVFDAEPEVPFEPVCWDHFRTERPFTHLFLCQSPGFTPASADALIPVIQEYLTPV